jgi:hypothetical protein
MTNAEADHAPSWHLWALSLVAHLVVLLLFLSNFLQRPRLLTRGTAVASFVLFAIWKLLAIALDIQYATTCGQGRDFHFPAQLAWMNADVVFVLCIVAWGAMIICAVTSVAQQAGAG